MDTAARRDDGVGAGISWVQRLVAGIIGGVVGGLAFGALMAMMGMLPMVASIVAVSRLWWAFSTTCSTA